MNERRRLMVRYLERLDTLAPAGYTAGLHIRFASPLYLRSTYPQEWQSLYAKRNYATRDPLVFWGIARSGSVRWSELKLPDPFRIMVKAREAGLVYGVAVSCGRGASRSIVGAARSDREYSDDEMAEIEEVTHGLHDVTEPPDDLSAEQIEALRLVGDGQGLEATAAALGIAKGALDTRLSQARDLLGATTMAEAVEMARGYRLL